jgi:transketolase
MSAEVSTAVTAGRAQQELDRLCVDTIRVLSMDAVQHARSGHPGLPMAMAPVAYLLYTRVLRHDPADPDWPDRDRFLLSAGHGSMLLYSVLHLAGYDLPLAEIERFRQWGSRTPGHPERILGHVLTPGVETTTGPLGQGFANGVGMALAERFLRERYGSEVMDHRIFALCSDGDLMEGVAAEAASLAGHLGLGRLVYVYDDNGITIDGGTSLSFSTEDVEGRFRAYGWQTLMVEDANDLEALEAALTAAIADEERPSLIRVRSIIGYPAPTKQGTPAAHGAPLGDDEVRATKEALGWDPDARFVVPEQVRAAFAVCRQRGARLQAEWAARFERWRRAYPDLAAEWSRAWAGRPEPGLAAALPRFEAAAGAKLATRAAGGKAMAAFDAYVPTMVGGSADLVESTKPRRVRVQRALGGARARHERRRERACAPRRDRQALRLDVPGVLRLHASGDSALRAHAPARRVGVHARLRGSGRGWAHPPADRALRGVAGDPGLGRDPAGRRKRDRPGVACCARGDCRARVPPAHPAGRPRARARRGA